MDTSNIEEDVSDDEIFFGKLTIKEIKKRLCNRQGPSKPNDDVCTKKDDPDSRLRLIETNSQPNLRLNTADSPGSSSQSGSPALGNDSDQSFIKIENVVSKLFVPKNAENVELNSTLEIMDHIQNHGPNHSIVQEPGVKKHDKQEMDMAILNSHSPLKESPVKQTPQMENLTLIDKAEDMDPLSYFTPSKSVTKMQLNEFVTPSNSINSKTPMFKTPACPSSMKKPSTSRLTPSKYAANAYKHISSPIASYIKNGPQAPLVKAHQPNKPLPTSCIPKLVRNSSQSKIQYKNKENTSLPSIAYKSAKNTKVVQLPDENRFPQSQRINKITSSVPRPTIMKHENRVMNPVKKQLQLNQENSFANLSCEQAEVSLCTEKTAFKSTNK